MYIHITIHIIHKTKALPRPRFWLTFCLVPSLLYWQRQTAVMSDTWGIGLGEIKGKDGKVQQDSLPRLAHTPCSLDRLRTSGTLSRRWQMPLWDLITTQGHVPEQVQISTATATVLTSIRRVLTAWYGAVSQAVATSTCTASGDAKSSAGSPRWTATPRRCRLIANPGAAAATHDPSLSHTSSSLSLLIFARLARAAGQKAERI